MRGGAGTSPTPPGHPRRPARAGAAARAYLDLQNLARREGRPPTYLD